MEGVEIEETDAEGLEEFKKIKLADYTKHTFGMYSGKVENVTMRFYNGMVGTVLDRFGRDVMKIPKGCSKLQPFFLCKGKSTEKFATPIMALSGLVMPFEENSFSSSDSKFVT